MRERVPLAGYTTFGIGGPASFFAECPDEAAVQAAVRWAGERRLPLFVLGGGSNLLVRDEGFDGLVVQIAIRGVVQDACTFDVGAGEGWDSFVSTATELGCAGVECLAGIPGSVGGTPVQNVGAYGQEVSETITSVRAFDLGTTEFVELDNKACRFRYRESLFNKDEPGRYIVTRVRFGLRPGGAPTLRYADLQRRLENLGTPTLKDVAAAVRAIRLEKGMVWVEGEPDSRSAGSFFKNPVVDLGRLAEIAAAAGVEIGAVPRWPVGEKQMKLPAAWLLERAGFSRGFGANSGRGLARLSSRHTLALTNWSGQAGSTDVCALADEIVDGVERRFGVRLEREPVLL